MTLQPIKVGAVIYDPKVVTIWQIIADFFEAEGCPIDTVFYKDYELQVDGLLNGEIDIAWNSPLAWVDCVLRSGNACRGLAMRDTDQDRVTHIIVRKGAGIETLPDLRGKTIAMGATDSPQATLIPIHFLQKNSLSANSDYTVKNFNVGVGLHGDHVGGELDALKDLMAGDSDAATVLDLNWERWCADGTADGERLRVLGTTDRFDHCIFACRNEFDADEERRWLDVLFRMSYDNPDHREMMDMEGLKEWRPGRLTGFGPLTAAVAEQRFFEK
ncbi:MAG: phosphate/phosphite/phosphonate ABC transporter substrate-binding protein [Armatimonadetes bacterium]|nr:phosphate/phosphite/phosphonate ABC transporter substrate-binding protein [Armatimonadota bacterium]NOG92868.1 phosphate/phosphite/phosphonate ABC transporter substrate-binding protein [Armatimonadota bacterium]